MENTVKEFKKYVLNQDVIKPNVFALTQEQQQYLKKRFEKLSQKPFVHYSADGTTKEEAIEMCKEHDHRVTQNIPHPQAEKEAPQEKQQLHKIKTTNKYEEI